jgi:hypothetical protein
MDTLNPNLSKEIASKTLGIEFRKYKDNILTLDLTLYFG